jgi:hypothetical protein
MMLSAIIAGIGVSWLVLRLIRRIDRTSRNGQGWLWIIIPVFGLVAVGFLYCVVEFVRNKGPDDWGATFHAVHVLHEKFGQSESPKINMTDYEYVKDASEQVSGMYRFHYRCAGQYGAIMVHYDKATGKFDSDEVISDK